MGRILVVDDDPDILVLAEQVLGAAGHTVFVAEDAIRAMDWLNQIDFDLLLSDANMPHYSGFDLIGTLRNDTRYKNMSVAMLTGLRERKDVERAVKMGVDDYIVKPIDPLILVQKINSLFEKRPAQTYPEISLSGTNMSKGGILHSVTVEAVSELGARVVCKMPLQIGQVIDLQCEFFRALEVEAPPMKVLNIHLDPATGEQRVQLIFLGAGEAFLQKIRRWLFSHAGSNRMAA